ncbi:MAG TPA: periplasmic heavy metal sensor [Candidatus Acidoferrum sp.]|nr:periplasmic heavy metal sensor [Candidatus Acidoferrum sp.]
MEIYSKAALALLAVALCSAPVLAQGDPQDPPPEQQGPQGGFGSMRHEGPGEERGRWGHRRDGFGGGERMGRRGFGREQGEFGLARLLKDPAIREKLGITAEQAGMIRKQVSDFRKAEIRERADLEVKRVDLRDLLEADKPDRAAIDSKLQEISTARFALEKSAVHFRLAMREAITPEQRKKLHELMSERWRHGGGPVRPGGPRGERHKGQHGPTPAPNAQAQPQPQPKN